MGYHKTREYPTETIEALDIFSPRPRLTRQSSEIRRQSYGVGAGRGISRGRLVRFAPVVRWILGPRPMDRGSFPRFLLVSDIRKS